MLDSFGARSDLEQRERISGYHVAKMRCALDMPTTKRLAADTHSSLGTLGGTEVLHELALGLEELCLSAVILLRCDVLIHHSVFSSVLHCAASITERPFHYRIHSQRSSPDHYARFASIVHVASSSPAPSRPGTPVSFSILHLPSVPCHDSWPMPCTTISQK